MKILQVGKFYPIRGGVEKVMYDLTLGLSEQGTPCDMLCASTEDFPAQTVILNPLAKIMVLPTQLKLAATMLAPNMIWTLRKIASQYMIIHIHHPDPMACLALFLSGYKGKVVLHWHSDILKQKTLLKLYKPLQNWLIKRADLIVGTTPVYVKESVFLERVQHKVDYIPIGVLPVLAPSAQVSVLREKYAGKRLIFSLGRLVEYKGYAYLIRAAQKLDDQYKIVIGGKGPLMESLQALILELQVQDRVELLGFVGDEDAHAYFEACDAFCLSSTIKTEAFAIVQIEAMSCGKPIISTAIPGSGVSWVNQHLESGLIVPIEDADALAQAFINLFSDPSQFEKLKEGSKNRFSNHFTRSAMVAKSLHLYNKILLVR